MIAIVGLILERQCENQTYVLQQPENCLSTPGQESCFLSNQHFWAYHWVPLLYYYRSLPAR